MYKDNKVITVKLTDVEEGWNFDKTGDTQVNCIFHSKSCSSQTHRWQVPPFLEFQTAYHMRRTCPSRPKLTGQQQVRPCIVTDARKR